MNLDPFKEAGEQGSAEWLFERVGHCTASKFGAVLAKLKNGGPSEIRQKYLWEVVTERLTGQPAQRFVSTAMQHGTEQEPMARMAYERRTGAMVLETGFRMHPRIGHCGGSPDGLIGDDGGAEFKCPWNAANHLGCWLDGMPAEHLPQIQGYMAIFGRDWWDFGSWHPDMPPELRLYVQRIPRDAEYIATLEAEIVKFLAQVDSLLARIRLSAGLPITPVPAPSPAGFPSGGGEAQAGVNPEA